MTPVEVCEVLAPLMDLEREFHGLNGPASQWLAERVTPGAVGAMTISQVLDLLHEMKDAFR